MFKYDKLNACSIIGAPPAERVVEFSPSGLDAGDVARVLSLAVDGRALSVEAGEGFAVVNGRVNFRLVWQDRDGKPRGADYNADFNLRAEGGFSPEDNVTAEVSVTEADVRTGDKVVLTALISVRTEAMHRTEEECLTDAENCYKTTESVLLPVLAAAKTATVSVSEEAEAGEIDSVLLADARATAVSATAGDGVVTVEGRMRAAVTFLSDGEIASREMLIPFKEEVSAEGVQAGDAVCAGAALGSTRIVLAGVPGAEVIRFEGEVALKVQAVRLVERDVIADMFMLTNEVDLVRETRKYTYCGGMTYSSEAVSGTASLEGRAAAESVIAVPFSRCLAAKAEVTDDGALVEGVLVADIVYRGADGIESVRAEVPYSVEIDGDFGAGVSASCFVENIRAKARRGELDVEADVGVLLRSERCCEAEFVSSVEVGEEKERNDSALSLYIVAEGDEMWDVCKALTATPDDIMAQNPALSLPLSPGDRVVYFRALG